jgi:hypothetical protein
MSLSIKLLSLITFAIFSPLKVFAQDIDGTYKLVIEKSPVVQSRVDRSVYQYKDILKDHSKGKEIKQYKLDYAKELGLYSLEGGFVTEQDKIEKTLYASKVNSILNKKGEYQFHTLIIAENKFKFAAPDGYGSALPELCTISALNEIDGLICEGSRNLVGSIFYDNQNQTITVSLYGGKTVYKLR